MKRILINATHNEEVRVALCKGNHLYDFDLENRTREQKKSNIYKGHVTRVEPSLEAVFVEYGSKRQGFLPIREIAGDYLSGNPREENIRKLIKEGDELIVQVEKEERGNKGAALSTYVSLAGRYLVLMPNNPKGGGISRQISGKLREDMKRMLGNLDLPKGMSVIIRTAGIGKTQDDLQHDLNHLLNIWNAIQEQNEKYPSPRLVHQEAGVVTRAVRDYLRDDVSEIWIDNEDAFIEAETFVKAVMPKQLDKLRKYTEYEPMFASFGVERQIETAYQREVRLPSGGSIVIDQTEALVAIDINSAKSTKGADVAETAYHTNLEAADEIARQLRLRDMGGLVVIDFIDMSDNKHQKEVEKRLVEATKYDRARVQFGDISRFGLLEMSRQRLRPSLEEATGYICPRCHGNGMIRDLRSLSLSIMRQIEQTALKERHGEVQAEVPTDIAAFLLNEKRESLVYLEQDSGTRITILPHAHLESPNFNLHFNHQGFAPSSYERVTDTQLQESTGRGYEVDWQTAETERPEHQPTRQPRPTALATDNAGKAPAPDSIQSNVQSNDRPAARATAVNPTAVDTAPLATANSAAPAKQQAQINPNKPAAVAWLSNLFAPTPQAQTAAAVSSAEAAQAIEAIVNTGAQSLGAFGEMTTTVTAPQNKATSTSATPASNRQANTNANVNTNDDDATSDADKERQQRQRARNSNRGRNKYDKKTDRNKPSNRRHNADREDNKASDTSINSSHANNVEPTDRSDNRSGSRSDYKTQDNQNQDSTAQRQLPKREAYSKRDSRGAIQRGQAQQPGQSSSALANRAESRADKERQNDGVSQLNEVHLKVNEATSVHKPVEVVHISLDGTQATVQATDKAATMTAPSSAVASSKTAQTANAAVSGDRVSERSNDTPNEAAASVKKNETADDAPVTPARLDEANRQLAGHSAADSNAPAYPVSSADSATAAVPAKQAHEDLREDQASHLVEKEAPAVAKEISSPSNLSSAIASANASAINGASTDSSHNSYESNNDSEQVRQESPETRAEAIQKKEDSPRVMLGFDTQALFANRYVTAQKFGQAHNDPRLIKAAMMRMQAADAQADSGMPITGTSSTDANDKTHNISRGAISGHTVGEFIHTHLANASLRLQKDGVIRCFLAALSAHRQTSGIEPVTDLTIAAIIPEPVFNFVNYGYEPLSQNYLQQFHKLTAAVNTYTAEAGKVETSPPAVSARAANDPRGQHPAYTPIPSVTAAVPAPEPIEDGSSITAAVASNVSTVVDNLGVLDDLANKTQTTTTGDHAITAQSNPAVVNTDTAAVSNKTPAEAMGELLALNVGEFVCRVLGQEGRDMLASGHTEAAFLKALRQPLDVLLLVANQRHTAMLANAETVVTKHDTVSSIDTDDEVGNVEGADNIDNADHADHAESTNKTNSTEITSANAAEVMTVVESQTVAPEASEPETTSLETTQIDAPEPDNVSRSNDAPTTPPIHSPNKTSIESYKSMIEHISEQLLPQTGLLKLSNVKVPKFPKPRARKAKEELKEEPKKDLKTESADSSPADNDEGQ